MSSRQEQEQELIEVAHEQIDKSTSYLLLSVQGDGCYYLNIIGCEEDWYALRDGVNEFSGFFNNDEELEKMREVWNQSET